MEWLRRLLLPIDQGSEFAKHIDFMYMVILWLSIVLFLMLMIPMVYFAWRYRFKPGRVTPHQTHNTAMEVTWTVIPLLLCVALFFWVWIRPEPYWLAITLAGLAPVLALAVVALSGGRIALWSSDARPKLGWLMYAGLVVPLRAMIDIHLYHWQPALAPVGLLAVLCVAVSWIVDRRISEKTLLLALYGLVCLAFSWGAVLEANVLLDRSGAVRITGVKVLGKSISSGKHTSYDLKLAPWGDRTQPESVDVGRTIYDAVPAGSFACVYLRPGRLHIRWFIVRPCRFLAPRA